MSAEAETATLGAMILDPSIAYRCAEELQPEDFLEPTYGDLFRLLREAVREKCPLDAVTLLALAKKKGILQNKGGSQGAAAVIEAIMNAPPFSENGEHYARIVRSAGERRRIQNLAIQLSREAADETLDTEAIVSSFTAQLRGALGKSGARGMSIAAALDEAFRQMEDETRTETLPTGIPEFDAQFRGVPRHGVTIVGARPTVGKTAFVAQFASYQAVVEGRSVRVYSLERDEPDIGRLMICQMTGVPMHRMDPGVIRSQRESDDLFAARHRLSQLERSVWISGDSRVSPMRIRADLARLPENERPEIVVIDYLGLLDTNGCPGGKGRTRENEISYLSRELKIIQQEFKVCLVVCSQLNRQSVGRVGDGFPRLSDLRDSGSIEQDADMVLLLHRPSATITDPTQRDGAGNIAHVIVAKNRRGATGTVDLSFNGPAQRFEALAVPFN